MRLPQPLLESLWFTFPSVNDLIAALDYPPDVQATIRSLSERGLPPIVSTDALATMLGVNSGLIWSFVNRPHRHYNSFTIKKGRGERQIVAPRVALKVFQKWMSFHLSRFYEAPTHVFGFVPGRSHIQAVLKHTGAKWAFSVDIEDFFSSTPQVDVEFALRSLGYNTSSASLIASLVCYRGVLAQGAPSSPTLSNVCFSSVDARLVEVAEHFEATLTRYADDIVFSGTASMPAGLPEAVRTALAGSPWKINEAKTRLEPLKGRIKVHGLLVTDDRVRLTKGYRNRLRAYKHVLVKSDSPTNEKKLLGHLNYAHLVSKTTGQEQVKDLADALSRRKPSVRNASPSNSDPLVKGPSVFPPEQQSFWSKLGKWATSVFRN